MPCPYTGLNVPSASPRTVRPSGHRADFSRYRRTLLVDRLRCTSVSGSAPEISRPTMGSGSASVYRRKPSGSAGGSPPRVPPRLTIHRSPSIGSTIPLRPGRDPYGSGCTMVSGNRSAPSGTR
ncbi:hypothetical protein GCM10019016_040450 [Streptomyces prasinosporus]|uniref:Uncharacterized protein n=1 Tax=Streptomyces prasinosporus TaxID=68256 RepID=A0ABP6TQ99_9ACTN